MLEKRILPRISKTAKIVPITIHGKEDSLDPSKYRQISMLNIVGKVLEKSLINRIMYHIYKIDYINDNQFGFIPQKSTTDAVMAVKQFMDPELEKGRVVTVANDAAWWPAIIEELNTP